MLVWRAMGVSVGSQDKAAKFNFGETRNGHFTERYDRPQHGLVRLTSVTEYYV